MCFDIDAVESAQPEGDFDDEFGHAHLHHCWNRVRSRASLSVDILDLAGIAMAVEADDYARDAGARQCFKQRGLVESEK